MMLIDCNTSFPIIKTLNSHLSSLNSYYTSGKKFQIKKKKTEFFHSTISGYEWTLYCVEDSHLSSQSELKY